MRILVTTGSSGGHIFPALSFLDKLKGRSEKIEVLLVLPKRSLKNNIVPQGCNVKYISILPVTLSPSKKNLRALWGLSKGAFESAFTLIEFKPDAVVGFGTIETVPTVLLAWLFRVRTLMHNRMSCRAGRIGCWQSLWIESQFLFRKPKIIWVVRIK